jgi:hypothetical protein
MKTYTSREMCKLLGLRFADNSHSHGSALNRAQADGKCQNVGRNKWVLPEANNRLLPAPSALELLEQRVAAIESALGMEAPCLPTSAPQPAPAQPPICSAKTAAMFACWEAEVRGAAKAAGVRFPALVDDLSRIAKYLPARPALGGNRMVPTGIYSDSTLRRLGWTEDGDQLVAPPEWGTLRAQFGLQPCKVAK